MDEEDDLSLAAADWSELPEDLLGLIMDTLMKKNTCFLLGFIWFGAVCVEWRSFSIQNYDPIRLPSNLPLLLIPNYSQEDYYFPNYSQEDYYYYNDEEDVDEYNQDYDNNHEEEEEVDEYNHDYDNNHEEEEENHDYDNNHEEEEEDEQQQEDQQDQVPDEHYYEQQQQEQEEQDPDEKQLQLPDYYKPKHIWKGQGHQTTRSFYSLSEGKVYQEDYFQLPVPSYKNCRGSSYGWLVTVDEEEQPDGTTYSYPVRLLNPFRSFNNEIQLPPLTPIPELDEEPWSSYYLLKAYLSANPSSLSNPSDLIVFGVYGSNRFGFCRPGDTAWTYVPLHNQFRPIEDLICYKGRNQFRPIEDLICYKGRFLAIIQEGSVFELDFAHHLPEPSAKFIAGTPTNGCSFDKKYLVESGGDLLQVQRHNLSDDYSTTGFRAFKLNDDAADDDKWVEMDNLDGRILFLGDNSSISLSADFPGVMPNCIYFTDDNYEGYEHDDWDGPHDIGIFNFEDKSVVFHDYGSMMPPPIWIQPML